MDNKNSLKITTKTTPLHEKSEFRFIIMRFTNCDIDAYICFMN